MNWVVKKETHNTTCLFLRALTPAARLLQNTSTSRTTRKGVKLIAHFKPVQKSKLITLCTQVSQ